MDENMKTILIVEDDKALATGLCRAFRAADMEAVSCGSISEARRQLQERRYELVVLDVNLPDGDGFSLLAEIKSGSHIPVIMLTANDMESDVVAGLELGADDYVTKPFSLAVLRARVYTQLRKQEERKQIVNETLSNMNDNKFECDDYVFDFEHMEFYFAGERIELSKTEQKLLRILTMNAGLTLTRDTLIDRIWTDGAEYVDENALSVTVKRLRDKLSAASYIKTIYGVGYTWTKKS